MVIEIGQVVQDFTVIMIIASVMALISYKLKQPMVIGFIIAGMIIGPYTPPFSLITSTEVLNLFAEIGVILVLFVVGMEFPIAKLRKIGKRAFIIASSEAFGTFVIGFMVGHSVLQYQMFDSLFLALAISVTSTVIVMRILEELNMIQDEATTLILGVAVIEDIIIISMLAILQSVASSPLGDVSVFEIATSIGLVLAFIGGVLFLGSKVVPRFINYVGSTNQHDILVVAMLSYGPNTVFQILEDIMKKYSVVNFVILTILWTLVLLVPQLSCAETLDEEVDEPFVLIVWKETDEAAKVKYEKPAQELQAFLDEIPGKLHCLGWTPWLKKILPYIYVGQVDFSKI
jgi:Sodium/hydrogen exchanger family